MTKEELLSKIKPSKRPEHLRKGQYIFNWIDQHFQIPEQFNLKIVVLLDRYNLLIKLIVFMTIQKSMNLLTRV